MVDVRPALPRYDVMTYSGSNGAEIVSYINDISSEVYTEGYLVLTSEDAGVAIIDENYFGGNQFTVNTGDLVVFRAYVMEVHNPTEFFRKFEYTSDAVTGSLPPVEPLDAPELIQSIGSDAVPLLVASGSTTVQVTIDPAFPDTNYSTAATLVGSASLLAALNITSVSKFSGSRVDVTVQNTGLISISGGFAVVVAVAYDGT